MTPTTHPGILGLSADSVRVRPDNGRLPAMRTVSDGGCSGGTSIAWPLSVLRTPEDGAKAARARLKREHIDGERFQAFAVRGACAATRLLGLRS